MTKIIEVNSKKILVIEPEEPQKCEYCGSIAETRPYGKNDAEICFECAMKPENKEALGRIKKIMKMVDYVVFG